jgi:hypothetical protein
MSSTLSALPGAYDLVLKGGRVIDPASGMDAIQLLHPETVVRAGKVIKTDSPLLPDLEQLAA